MKGKKPHEAAQIEAYEEAGVKGRVHGIPTGRYTYLKTLEDGDVAPCIVDVFEIEVLETVTKFKERGERVLAWLTLDEAARRVREIELKALLIGFTPATKA